MVFSFSLSSI
jgi:DNA-binding MarR family transcriptional regulator